MAEIDDRTHGEYLAGEALDDSALTEQPHPPEGLVRSSAVVAVGTALSRLTGLARLGATAYALGFTRLTDTYTLANTTPNIVYELLLGGVLSATLVPIFVEHQQRDDDDATSAVVSVAAVLLVAVTVVGLLAAPAIVDVYTLSVPGQVAEDQRQVATALLRLFMPQMLFYGLTAMATAILTARRRFAVPALAPALNNLLVTGVLLALPRLAGGTPSLGDVRDDPVLLVTLGLGTTAGVMAMTAVLLPALRAARVRLRPLVDWRHPAVRQVGRLSGWTAGYVLANQVSLLVALVLANRQEGGVSAYTVAFIFLLLPHALFAVSLMTALVPELSAAAGRGDLAAYRERFGTGLRLLALVVLPAATGYLVLARPIVSALLERGALSGASADLTADTLAAFAVGLGGFSLYLYVLRGFYALRDTRTPFVLNVGQNVVQVGIAVALEPVLGVPGLALAHGGAYTAAGVVSLVVLRRRVGALDVTRLALAVGRVVLACAAMAAAVIVIAGAVGADEGGGAVVRTAVGMVVGLATYAACTLALGGDEVGAIVSRLRARRRV